MIGIVSDLEAVVLQSAGGNDAQNAPEALRNASLHMPLAYFELVLATDGVIGSVQQLCPAISTTLPSARVMFAGGGEDLDCHVSRR